MPQPPSTHSHDPDRSVVAAANGSVPPEPHPSDLAERQRIAAAQVQLAAIVTSSDDAIIGKTLDGMVTSWNPAAERLFGWTAAEMIGHSILRIVPPERRAELTDILTRLGHGERIDRHETERTTRDGRRLHVSLSVSPIADETGRVIGAAKIARDVTAARRAADNLRFLADAGAVLAASLDQEETLSRIAHLVTPRLADWCTVHLAAADGTISQVVVSHADPAKVDWARELQERYPPDPAATNGVPQVVRTGTPELYPEIPEAMLEALPDDQRELVRSIGLHSAMIVPLVARGRSLGALTFVTAESGRRYDEADLAFAEELAQRCALAVDNARLYRERTEAEDEIRRLNEDLERRIVERTAALEAANNELEAFSYSVSHDLRAPLRAMDGFARILAEEYAASLPPEAQRYLSRVRHNATQMGMLVDDLLSLSRLGRQPLAKRRLQPADLVRQILADLLPESDDRRVEVVIGDLPACDADPVLLKQVYTNLLANALKFTRSRAVATIEVSWRPDETLPGGGAYHVHDNGVGFDMAYAEKLFGVFQRLHRAEDYEGTGVGLAIVHRIVHRHGGQIWAEGRVDGGATFAFALP